MAALTKRYVEGAGAGLHWDDRLPGFGLRVTGAGGAYVLQYRIGHGRKAPSRRITIGRHGAPWTPDTARQEALRLLAEVAKGKDPSAERRSETTDTVGAVLARWLEEIAAKRKPRTALDYRRLIARHVTRTALAKTAVAKVERRNIAKLHHGLAETPYEANHLLRVLSSFFTWCERHGYRPDGSNPCRHVVLYREEKRRRYLSPRELRRLARALAVAERCGAVTPWMAAAIRLLVLTGARLGEVLGLRWEWVDLSRGDLRLPDSKTGAKVVHLNAPARAVVAGLAKVDGNPFVIVGGKEGRCLVNLEKPWRRVRKAALLNDVRLHDLRHSHASVGAAAGLSLPLIGALLGHSQPATTARYAHLADDPVKAAAELIGERLTAAMVGAAGEVIPLRRVGR
jgi:integrase